jgi:hypothetical protein
VAFSILIIFSLLNNIRFKTRVFLTCGMHMLKYVKIVTFY